MEKIFNGIRVSKDKIILFIFSVYFLFLYISFISFWLSLKMQFIPYYGATIEAFLLRSYNFVPQIFIIIFLTALFFNGKKLFLKFAFEKILFSFIILAASGFLVGLFYKNDLAYLLGDTQALIFVPSFYFLGVLLYYPGSLKKIIKAFFYFFLAASFIGLLIQVVSAIRLNGIMVISIDDFIFPLTFLFLKDNKNKKEWFLIALLTISGILTLKRGNMLTIFLIFLLPIIIENGWQKKIKRIKNIIVLVAIIASIWGISSLFISNEFSNITRRYRTIIYDFSHSSSSEEAAQGPIKGRLREGSAVFEQMKNEGNIFNWIIGFGNGAQWNVKYLPMDRLTAILENESSVVSVHPIHGAWFTFFFRNGIVGVMLFAIFNLLIIYKLWRGIKRRIFSPPYDFYAKFLFVLFFIHFVSSYGAYTFWKDMTMALLLIMIGYLFYENSNFSAQGMFALGEKNKDEKLQFFAQGGSIHQA